MKIIKILKFHLRLSIKRPVFTVRNGVKEAVIIYLNLQ